MSNWRTTAITLPQWFADENLPADLSTLEGFEHYAQNVALDIEQGGAVDLQRINAVGEWETFETASEVTDYVMVANRAAIRFSPVNGAAYQLRWKP